MEDSAFSDAFCQFVQQITPSVAAAEMLLVLAREPNRWWDMDELLAGQPPGTESEALRYFDTVWKQLVTVGPDKRVQYSAATFELNECVHMLQRAYNERPVTLIRMIYALRDSQIR